MLITEATTQYYILASCYIKNCMLPLKENLITCKSYMYMQRNIQPPPFIHMYSDFLLI
jgi:hypothetical protein